jgi:hypothetical protein
MSEKNQSGDKKSINEGYVPEKRGYRPSGDNVTGGHKPEKTELKPINPPKKK